MGVEEVAASLREGLQLSPSAKRIEDVRPSLAAHGLTAGEISHVGVADADRSTRALVQLEDTVQKVLKAWHPASVRAAEWDHRLVLDVFWNHVLPLLGKEDSPLRNLYGLLVFFLSTCLLSQLSYPHSSWKTCFHLKTLELLSSCSGS